MSLNKDTKGYCVCHGVDDGRPMIHCDNCKNWFHFNCINLDEDTAAEIYLYHCEPCTAQTKQETTFSWQLTDDELSFVPKAIEQPEVPKPRTKHRPSQSLVSVKQKTTPVVPSAAPTFALEDSDSDTGMKDDDGEYTERQLTRIRRGKQERRADSSSERSPSPDVKHRKRKASNPLASTSKRKKTLTAKSPSPLSDPVRKYCYGKLQEVIEPIFLEYRTIEADVEVDDETAKSLASKFVTELEEAIFNQHGEPDKKGNRSAGPKYKERFRMLTYNLGQADRVSLRQGIGTGKITATVLSEMSSAELANEQAKQDMEKAAQEALHQSILKVQTSLPRAKMTHKGEEIIESSVSEDLQRAGEEEERERVRMRLRVRTGSILDGNPESAATLSSVTGISSSIFGENRPMDVDGGTPISPEQVSSPVIATGVRPTVMSPLASNFPINSNVVSSPVQDKFSPMDEPKATPTVGIIRSRPSFDLSALWSGGPDGEMKASTGMDEITPIPPDEENEAEMDLDDDQPGDQDFGMFLEGVEEPGHLSTTTKSTTPPPLTQNDNNLQSLPIIWSGELIMPLDPNPALINNVSVKQVGGRSLGEQPSVWSQLFTKPKTLIEGRVPTDRATKYLVTTRLNASRELIVVLFEPKDSKTMFTELFDFLVKKDRHGLVFPWGTPPPSSAPGKDLYLIPLQASQPLPEFIDLLDQVQIPKKRDENMLLGVFVLNKGKVIVPPSVVPVVPAARSVVDTGNSPVPVTSLPSQNPVQSDTLQSFVSSLGAANASLPYGVNPSPPVPIMPGMPQIPAQVHGMPYSYHNQMMMPPPNPAAIPPTSTANFSALADSIKNMTPDQINLILKGLSMANSNPAAGSSLPPASSWNPPPPSDPMYPYMDSHSGQGPPPRSPTQSSRSRDWDDRYSRDRDRERRSSPPYRGRPNKPRERDERRDRGRNPRDRRGEYGSSDGGWARR